MELNLKKSLNNIKFLNYWNKMYEDKNVFGTGETKLARYAQELLKNYSVENMLEIGCGQGRDSIFFAQLGYKIKSFDISHNAIEFVSELKKKHELKNLEAKSHDARIPYDYPDEHFDFIYSNLALQFFDVIELRTIFRNVSKVIKKDAPFFFSSKKIGDKYHNTGTKINDYAYSFKGVIRYFYDEQTWSDILSEYFDVIKIDFDEHVNLDETKSVWWKILVKKK